MKKIFAVLLVFLSATALIQAPTNFQALPIRTGVAFTLRADHTQIEADKTLLYVVYDNGAVIKTLAKGTAWVAGTVSIPLTSGLSTTGYHQLTLGASSSTTDISPATTSISSSFTVLVGQ